MPGIADHPPEAALKAGRRMGLLAIVVDVFSGSVGAQVGPGAAGL